MAAPGENVASPGDEQAAVPEGYRDIPEADRRRAQAFFDKARTVAETGNYEYAIELYLQGLASDPQNIDAHQALREVSIKRKASGGKDLGMFEKMKLKRPSKDDKQNMLAAEKALAYDPGNTDVMVLILQNAHRAGFFDTVLWIGPILQRANADGKSPDAGKYIILKDIYKSLRLWKLAADACHLAAQLRPDDMDLQPELKNLGALQTMDQGKYGSAKSFRDSIRDMDKQRQLLDGDKDIRSEELMLRMVRDTEAEYKANPGDINRMRKFIDVLERTEQTEHENRAIELLDEAFRATKQFAYRQRVGKIKMTQLRRMERSMRQAAEQDKSLEKDLEAFRAEKLQFELDEYTLWAENYPTENSLRYEVGLRLFALRRYNQAIPVLQTVRSDPRFRFEASLLLGRCFLEMSFVDEAVETLQGVIDDYPARGDDISKEMHYWQGRSLELKNDRDQAIKRYSQLAQWDFNYRDVQVRIRNLRGQRQPNGQA